MHWKRYSEARGWYTMGSVSYQMVDETDLRGSVDEYSMGSIDQIWDGSVNLLIYGSVSGFSFMQRDIIIWHP